MRRILLVCTAVITLIGAGSVAAAPALSEFEAQYGAYKGSLRVAESIVRLQRHGSTYVYSSVTAPAGMLSLVRRDEVSERSVWTMHDGGIRPLEYHYVHKRSKKERDVALHFDWQQGEVANTVQGHTWTMDIPDGTLDKFSVQLAVMLDLQRDDAGLRYQVADGGKLKQYRFRKLGVERVQTRAGEFEAVKLQRLRRRDKDRETYMWCAPSLQYLIVRMKHLDDDGGEFHLELERIDQL